MPARFRPIQRRKRQFACQPQDHQESGNPKDISHVATGCETLPAANQRLFEIPYSAPHFAPVEAKAPKLSFEDALTQLETIVETMESGEVPLAELLAKFEEGSNLLKICETRLKDAELKIEQLKRQKDGVAFTKFETTSEA
jgi:exodeoxyribonuclease VII small subunit